ncbi:MAG TPA: molybdopterin cofactor-binding domain-containing protein [Tepidisphaeraceae bacterium]|jgi:isoquinoline 1-oxidoreductase|nr:molybdopterin cofactor-binding domain-containing protein [Tepidisphaeraceae bacterium]
MSQTTQTLTVTPGERLRPNVTRRRFLKSLSAGLLIAVSASPIVAQEAPEAPEGRRLGRNRGPSQEGPVPIAARIHIARDGTITVMTGKVECGQGARAEISMAAAEELRVSPDQIVLIMGDTTLCPDDGGTYGSMTTPRTIPSIRNGCAAARQALAAIAGDQWKTKAADVQIKDGHVIDVSSGKQLSYGELVGEGLAKAFTQSPSRDVQITTVTHWKVLGTPYLRSDRRELVDGSHVYPTDIVRPGMLYGKILRPPSYGATLTSINLSAVKSMADVRVARDGEFVGVAGPSYTRAQQALDALAKTAVWRQVPHISSVELYNHLKENALNGIPQNPFADDLLKAAVSIRQEYHVAYIQHAPLEPRVATAEWTGGNLTVWTGTQNPFGVRGDLVRALGISPDSVRVIVPDFGGAFGGKHIGDPAVEAARLARGIGKPVHLRWTREEEFTWAYFRPAGVILAEAGLDAAGVISSWFFVNINSGPQGIEPPYRVGRHHSGFLPSDPPLRQGSYRALASTANHFAREVLMDELAVAAHTDPLAFRLANLESSRLKNVLRTAADKFGWAAQSAKKIPNTGVGLACGTDKGSYVAACAAVSIDPKTSAITVTRVTEAFDCGPIHNPAGLLSQVQGAILMGLGADLREEIRFDNGQIANDNFADYAPPRFADVPEIDVHLIDTRDVSPAGAGEIPIIAIAPAIANAVYSATGQRIRQMPIRLS